MACSSSTFGTDPIFGTAKNCYVAAAGAPPGNWTQCANENSTCSVVGVQPVAFGADGAFWIGTSSGATACGTGTFGVDPIFGVAKGCYTWTGAPPGFSKQCATESTDCAFTGRQTIAYGADGDYIYRTFTGGATCGNAAFGADPLFGVAKSCYVTS